MLHDLLAGSRERILALARSKAAALLKSKPADAALERRLPEYYQRLVLALGPAAGARGRHGKERPAPARGPAQAAYACVALCQAIMETAEAMRLELSAVERRALNRGVEHVIAESAADQVSRPRRSADNDAAVRMGFLVHELRNALACVFVAHAMLDKDPAGGASAMLKRNLLHMRSMLDLAYTEIRLHKRAQAHRRPMPIIEAAREVEFTAGDEARRKGLKLSVRVDPRLVVNADRLYLVSALANLVQNAVKFTKPGGSVWVRGLEKDGAAVLEVEDQCGGLPGGRIEDLFEPFTQRGEDRSGLGLGLAISRRAVALNHGTLTARPVPGKGCVFSITLPLVRGPALAGARADE